MGQAEILGVEDAPRDCSFGTKHITSVRPPAPWRDERVIFSGQQSQETAEGVGLVGEDAGDVFPDDEFRLDRVGEFAKNKGEVAAVITKPPPSAGH